MLKSTRKAEDSDKFSIRKYEKRIKELQAEGLALTELLIKKSKLIANKSAGYKLHVWPPKPRKEDPLVDIMIENGMLDFQIHSNVTMSGRFYQ